MPLTKYFTVVGSALLALLFACNAYFREGTDTSGGTSVIREGLATDELRLTEDVTPAARIKETFALFVPGDARRVHDTVRLLARAAKPQA